jgi:hypothetical protein
MAWSLPSRAAGPGHTKENAMAETLLQFPTALIGSDGIEYLARACGAPAPGGTWHGWIEFVPTGAGRPIRTPRETTQPNRVDTEYWAGGLTAVYLEGALDRALNPVRVVHPEPLPPPAFSGPAPTTAPERNAEAILNPFSVYEKGEDLLRRQLAAFSSWHLVNIIVAYRLSADSRERLNRLSPARLIDRIVTAVREEVEGTRTTRRATLFRRLFPRARRV